MNTEQKMNTEQNMSTEQNMNAQDSSAAPAAPAAGPGTAAGPRVAVVTGGSRGIGRAVVTRLAAEGYAVVVGNAGSRAAAEQAVAEVGATSGRALAVQADVADEKAVAALFDTAQEQFGGVDAVVNAAGRMTLSTVADLDLNELDALHRTNIRGTFVVAQQAARRLRPGGALVMFSTSVVGTAFPTYGAYAASKGAVETLTMILARELRGRDVTVNTVARVRRAPTCSWTARARNWSPGWPSRTRWSGSAPRRTSPRWSPSWPGRAATGSTARCCAPTAAWSDRRYGLTVRATSTRSTSSRVVRMMNAFLPLLAKAEASRVVNVTSKRGSIGEAGAWVGQPSMAYSSSKTALNALTVHYAREFADGPLKVNGAAPGHVATDFNDFRGTRTPDEGAAVAIWLATLGPDGPTGAVFEDDVQLAW